MGGLSLTQLANVSKSAATPGKAAKTLYHMKFEE